MLLIDVSLRNNCITWTTDPATSGSLAIRSNPRASRCRERRHDSKASPRYLKGTKIYIEQDFQWQISSHGFLSGHFVAKKT